MSLTVGSLFAGIGGFELAATWAGITPIWSNEIDPFCCKVLRKNFDHEIIQKDIRKIQKNDLEPIDIICGGDPCQPNSYAGLGKGTADHRFLWPEKFRIIRAIQPSWVVNENVSGSITNGVLDLKIDDLESEGYTCQAYCIPTESVGALHQRERVWLIAHNPNGTRCRQQYITNNQRNKRIKALGNAIVAQVAYEIFKAIVEQKNY